MAQWEADFPPFDLPPTRRRPGRWPLPGRHEETIHGRSCSHTDEGTSMYIGVGTLVVILIIVLIVYLARRA